MASFRAEDSLHGQDAPYRSSIIAKKDATKRDERPSKMLVAEGTKENNLPITIAGTADPAASAGCLNIKPILLMLLGGR